MNPELVVPSIADAPAVLLSVQPHFARPLMLGTKTAEIRRRFPHHLRERLTYIYSSSPERQLIGTIVIRRVVEVESAAAWALFGSRLRITNEALTEYLKGSAVSYVLEVDTPQWFKTAISLETLRSATGISPPQSYRYLDAQTQTTIGNLTS